MSEARVLIVEDDDEIAQLIGLHLREAGWQIDIVHDGERGFEQALSNDYDLIVLDVVLPNLSGTDICKRLRAQGSGVLILMLTARSSEFDKVLGLELGADDYLTKPFSFRELQARVKALLRRKIKAEGSPAHAPEMIQTQNLKIDAEKREVTLQGRRLILTLKEFDLLLQFARHPGKVYTRAELLDSVWGYGYQGLEHTVNTHINRLRAKLEQDPTNPEYIQTVWGIGYRFNAAKLS